MSVYTVKKYGNGLHIVLSKKEYKEGQVISINEQENQASISNKETKNYKDNSSQNADKKASYLSIGKDDTCPYYSNTGNELCRASSIIKTYPNCNGLLSKCTRNSANNPQ